MAKPKLPQTLSMGRNFLFCLFFVFSKFLPPWPKNAPKLMETHKKTNKKSFTPCRQSSFSSDLLHGSKLLFFLIFSRFVPFGPRMPQNPWKKQKTKTFHPMSPVQLLLRPSPWVETVCFFGFLEVFATLSVQQCQLLIFLCFLFSCFLGSWEIFTLPSIHWHSFHSSTFYIDAFIELLILATEPSEKMYSKNSSITHLFR